MKNEVLRKMREDHGMKNGLAPIQRTGTIILFSFFIFSLSIASCSRDTDFVPPAFLHVEGITLRQTPTITTNEGFYTHDIVAAYVVAHYPGRSSVDTVGLFRMPFTIPILYDGKADYIDIFPAVEQSGISGAMPYYTFYLPIHHTAADSTTLRTGDTLNLGVDTTAYRPHPLVDTLQLFEHFERPRAGIRFSTPLQWVEDDPAGACTGDGYGHLTVSPSDGGFVTFDATDTFSVTDPGKIIYLELDIKNTLPLSVYMRASSRAGQAEDRIPVMTVNPINHWQHLYINLGRTWAYFNHPSTFRLSFSAVDENGSGGTIDIDNVKLITTSISL